MVDLFLFVDDNVSGGHRCTYIVMLLPGHQIGSTDLWSRYMCGDPPHREGPMWVSPLGVMMDCWEGNTSTIQWYMGLPPYVGGHEGSGPGGYVDLYLQASEYCGIIHSSSAHFLPMTGGGAEASIAGVEEMVVLLCVVTPPIGRVLCGFHHWVS